MNNKVEINTTETIPLKELIQGEQSLVIFVRHLGWPVCREFLTQLRDQFNEIAEHRVKVVVVAPSKFTFIQQFLEAFGPYPFPIYGDPGRKLYREMGHVTMPKWKLLGMAAIGYMSGKMKHFIPKEEIKKKFVLKSMKTQDVYIQGGTWLFGKDGSILWNHIDSSPVDHPTAKEIIQKLQETL